MNIGNPEGVKPQSFAGSRWEVYEGALVSQGNYKNLVIVLYGRAGRFYVLIKSGWKLTQCYAVPVNFIVIRFISMLF